MPFVSFGEADSTSPLGLVGMQGRSSGGGAAILSSPPADGHLTGALCWSGVGASRVVGFPARTRVSVR